MNNHNSLTSNCVQKLVIIDSRVSNYWELIAGVLPNTMVLVLDDNQDSIDQISNVLQSHNSIESLHLVAHGAPGQLFLGNNTLQAINLDYLSGKIAAWSQSLTQNAQILLYGCEAGAGNIGRELVEKLHSLTDRLVAAASKPIGLTAEIVNWDLDIRSADFQPSLAFQGKVLAEYTGFLAEPYLVRDLSSGNSRILANGGTNIGNTLYFSVGISTISSALLKTDGTENGTFFVSEVSVPLVKDSLLSFNDSIYFVNRSDLGRELWKTDGISTALLKDIVPGNAGSNPQQLTRAENKFFFTGTTSNSTNRSLFVSDGTPNGTAVISSPFPDIPRSLTSLNDKLIFVANDPQAGGENNYELWVSDGVNTSLLKDINGNPSVGSVNKAVKLTKAGNYIYFNANPGGAFEQLWKTDGTAAGTVRVKNFSLFSASIDVNGTLFGVNTGNIVKVNADDSSSAASVGGLFPFDEIIETDTLQNVNGTLFFTTKGRDPSTGNFSSKSLWKSDGTQVGTTRIKQDTSGLFDSLTRFVPGIKFSALGNKFYFAGQDQVNGEELWVSDGTAAGTKLVRDINPGSVSSNVEFVGKAGDKLYFSADNGQVGRELWAIQDDGSVTAEKPKDGVVTGGDPNGRLLNSDVESRRDRRNVGFEEIKNPQDGSGQTWVVIHGWNSSTGETNINELIQSIQGKVGANDRVLALNWQEAAANTSGLGDNLTSLAEGANARAATWITPVAEFAVRTLQERYGIDAAKASTSLNLVGHSLGSLLSSDIGRIYRDGGILVNPFPISPETANTAVAANGGGVRTITALDPASALNLPLNGFTYDLDGRIGGIQAPQNFANTSVFSRAYNGAQSIAGNKPLAVTADEAIEMDFGNTSADADEHGRVIQSFAKLFGQSGLIGDLLGVKSYQSVSTLSINDFDILTTPRVDTSGFRGVLNIEKSDSDTAVNNRANLLIGQAMTGINNDIVIGSAQDDDLQGSDSSSGVEGAGDRRYNGIGNDKLFGEDGNDTIRGKSGNDMLIGGIGNDILLGYGSAGTIPNTDDDLLYGGLGKDVLSGGYGSDTFVFKAGDGSTNLNNADTITDFQLGIDKIGLIGLVASQVTIRAVGGIAAISLGNEFLAKIKGQGISAAKLQSPDIFTVVSPDIFQVN